MDSFSFFKKGSRFQELYEYYRALFTINLIDVNLDIVGETTTPNRTIEEVTIVSKIDGKYVKKPKKMILTTKAPLPWSKYTKVE